MGGVTIMSKGLKRLIVFILIFFIFLSVALLVSAYVFKPSVTLDYCYKEVLGLSFLEKPESDYIPIVDYATTVRFSHYQAPTPTRDGYTFAGWYKDIGYTVAWINGRDRVTKDITLYAKWVKAT